MSNQPLVRVIEILAIADISLLGLMGVLGVLVLLSVWRKPMKAALVAVLTLMLLSDATTVALLVYHNYGSVWPALSAGVASMGLGLLLAATFRWLSPTGSSSEAERDWRNRKAGLLAAIGLTLLVAGFFLWAGTWRYAGVA